MSLQTTCPECGETLALSSRFDRSKSVRCPDCDTKFRPFPSRQRKSRVQESAKPISQWLYIGVGVGTLTLIFAGLFTAVLLKKNQDRTRDVAQNTEATAPTREPANPIAQPPTTLNSTPTPQATPPQTFPNRPITQPPRPRPRPGDDSPFPAPGRLTRPSAQGVEPIVLSPDIPNPFGPSGQATPNQPDDDRPVLVLNPGTHTGLIKTIRMSSDGQEFISFSDDKSIRIWDVKSGVSKKTIYMPAGQGDEGRIFCGDVSADGKWIATSVVPLSRRKEDVLIYLISKESGQVVRTMTGHQDIVHQVAFSADSEYLASAGQDGLAMVYRVSTGAIEAKLDGHDDPVKCIAMHPNGQVIATATTTGILRFWAKTPEGFALSKTIPNAHQNTIYALDWSSDGKLLASGGVDGNIRTWDFEGNLVQTYPAQRISTNTHIGHVKIFRLEFTRDNQHLAYGGAYTGGNCGILELATGKRIVDRIKMHNNTVMACATSPTEDVAITYGGNWSEIQIWSTLTGELIRKIEAAGSVIWNVRSVDDASVLLGIVPRHSNIQPENRFLYSFDMDNLTYRRITPKVTYGWDAVGAYFIRQTDNQTVIVYKNSDEYYRYELPKDMDEQIHCACLVPGDRLAIGTTSRLLLMDLNQKVLIREFIGHSGIINSVATLQGDRLISSSTDQTVRIWHLDQKEPVLSLFFCNQEWIAWTPEGYYAASTNGERLMGWQQNHGPNQTATYYPAIQFRRALYQPNVIRKLNITYGNVELALKLANQETVRNIQTVHLPDILPPQVEITSPTLINDQLLIAENQEVKLVAKSQGSATNPIKQMRLLVDGRPYQGREGARRFGENGTIDAQAEWQVKLSPGRHSVVVLAEAESSDGLSRPIEMVQHGRPLGKPNLYVCAIGISAYPGPLKLNYAAKDATAVSEVFEQKSNTIFNRVTVNLCTDKIATKANILDGIDWLQSKMTENDVGIFFFSGHGTIDDKGEFYLVPVDIQPAAIAKSCVSGELVKKRLMEIPGRMVCLLDACHSGSAAESLQVGDTGILARELAADDCGIVVMCSSMGNEFSMENRNIKAGFFTHALVEGLTGQADFNKDGVIYINEATQYISMRVQALTNGIQCPTLGSSSYLPPFPLSSK